MHDPCVIAYLLAPELFEGRDMRVDVELGDGPLLRADGLRSARAYRPLPPTPTYCSGVDADGFFAMLTERLARLPVDPHIGRGARDEPRSKTAHERPGR